VRIIAISGFKQSGKDTSAQYLIDNYGFVRTSFADPLKDMVSKEYGVPREYMDDPKHKEAPLLDFPVNPQDDFCKMLNNFMLLEFRSKYGNIYDPKCPDIKLFHTPRSLCILKGSVNRFVKSDYWVKKACEAIIQKTENGNSLHVISDLRYKSEMKQLSESFSENVTFIRINRFKESTSKDPSEMDLVNVPFDFYLDNTSSFEDLYREIDEIISK
jgi:hypothetical protein